MGNAHSRRVRAPRTLAENGIGNGPQETSVNTTAKTPAEPTPPQAHDQLPFADMNAAFVNFDTFDIVYKQTMKYLDPKDADTHSDYSAVVRDDDIMTSTASTGTTTLTTTTTSTCTSRV